MTSPHQSAKVIAIGFHNAGGVHHAARDHRDTISQKRFSKLEFLTDLNMFLSNTVFPVTAGFPGESTTNDRPNGGLQLVALLGTVVSR